MVNKSVTDLMQEHRFVRQVEHNEISEFDTFPMLEGLAKLQLGPAHIDLGKMVVKFQSTKGDGRTLDEFLVDELGDIIGSDIKPLPEPQDVVLYGFGRIGRLIARILVDKAGGGDVLRLRAIVIRKGKVDHDLEKRAALLRRDSVHGPFKGTVRVLEDQNTLVVNGNPIKIIYANSPEEIDYTTYGISNALIVDNTGVWKDTAGLSGHLRPGASKVLLTAPAGDDIPNIVYGINHHQITPDRKIISAASCTTNAIVPVLKCLLDEYGINSGHVETVHAYTNDQNLIDNYHKGGRRGRGAALNMVLTSTGAAKAVSKAIPELKGKLTGNAIRVPTPNVSIAILNLQLRSEVTTEAVNALLKHNALEGDLVEQIQYSLDAELVSSDIVGTTAPSIFDSKATITDGDTIVIYVWYDNEYGYSHQVIRLAKHIAKVRRYTYY